MGTLYRKVKLDGHEEWKKNEEIEDIEIDVKQGTIKRAFIYKYLGNWINEQGNMDTQLEVMEKRIGVIARETNLIACRDVVGRMKIAVKMLLYEMAITPTIFYNIEAWRNMRETDKDRLEVIQG